MQKTLLTYFQNITVYTKVQKIRKLEAINQKLSIGQITFSCYKYHYNSSLYVTNCTSFKRGVICCGCGFL